MLRGTLTRNLGAKHWWWLGWGKDGDWNAEARGDKQSPESSVTISFCSQPSLPPTQAGCSFHDKFRVGQKGGRGLQRKFSTSAGRQEDVMQRKKRARWRGEVGAHNAGS